MSAVRVTGKLLEHPMASLLVAVHTKRLTGSLTIEDGRGGRTTVYVRDGFPVHVDRTDTNDRLDRVLLDARLVSEEMLAMAQHLHARTKRLLGEILVERNLLTPQKLQYALSLQMQRKVTRLFDACDGTYDLAEGEHSFAAAPTGAGQAIDPRSLIHPGIDASNDDARLAAEMMPLLGRAVRVSPAVDVGFIDADAGVMASLRGQGLVIDRLVVSQASGELARKRRVLVLALYYLGYLESGAAGETPAPTARVIVPREGVQREIVATTPKTGSGPVPAGFRETPRTGSGSSLGGFGAPSRTAMGVPPSGFGGAPPTAMRPRPAGLTPPLATPPPPATATAPERRLDPALLDLARREPARVQRAGEAALDEADYERAIDSFDALVRAEPQNVRYQSYLAWAKCSQSPNPDSETLNEALKVFRKAVQDQPSFAMGHYFVGLALKLKKEPEKARKAFEAAINHDKNLFAAQRELRLMAMRGVGTGPTKPR
jgi:tetratricopeptide (TPR) repeat protein